MGRAAYSLFNVLLPAGNNGFAYIVCMSFSLNELQLCFCLLCHKVFFEVINFNRFSECISVWSSIANHKQQAHLYGMVFLIVSINCPGCALTFVKRVQCDLSNVSCLISCLDLSSNYSNSSRLYFDSSSSCQRIHRQFSSRSRVYSSVVITHRQTRVN